MQPFPGDCPDFRGTVVVAMQKRLIAAKMGLSPSRCLETSWYDHPQYYDLAFRGETRLEADFIEAACRKYCPFRARRLLEPACGTGRLITELSARGYRMTGLDLSRPSLEYLKGRLARRKLRASIFPADMADFRLDTPADAAYCTFDSFRHLLSEQAARRHLQCVAESLRPAASISSDSTSCRRTLPRSVPSVGPSGTGARKLRSHSACWSAIAAGESKGFA